MQKALTVCCVLLTLCTHAVADEKRGLLPTDFYSEVGVGQAALSPDGKLVAFTVTTVVEEDNKRHREIWIQALRNGQPQGDSYRFTAPTEESSSPRWSPDGNLLSFQSTRDDDENATWFIRVTAPGGEAFHIEGVDSAPTWSRDGKWIAFAKKPEDEEDETEGEDTENDKTEDEEGDKKSSKKSKKKEREGWIAPDALTSTLDEKRFDGRVITTIRYKRDGTRTLLPHRSATKKTQLFVVSAEGGEPVQLTDHSFDVSGVEWSGDNKTILYTGNPLQDDEYNTDLTTDIYAVSREGGESLRLTANPGAERAPAISPDGKKLAFLVTAERGAPTELKVVDIGASGVFHGDPRTLTTDWDLSPSAPEWTKNGKALRFSAGITGNRHLFEVSASGGNVRQITKGDRSLRSFSKSKDGRVFVYSATDALAPAELFVTRADGSNEKRFTHFNDEWLEEIDLMPAERLTWRVADGTEIEGWVVKPVGHEPEKKYPLILKIHGGPHGAYGNTWFRTFHILSAAGFFVLYPNPRGSTGYGHAFTYATKGKWGEVDREDYLGGVDAAVAKYPGIDPDLVGVSGGSYGGYMTAWLTATTNRFAVANPSRMIVNWESWYGASDAQGLTEFEFMGEPWEQRELYRKLSPLSYVENVTAPTLIIHSENDFRTPIADAEQWFMALKKRNVPVEMVRYPRSSHGLSRTGEPWLLVDRLERIKSWFQHWLIGEGLKDLPARR